MLKFSGAFLLIGATTPFIAVKVEGHDGMFAMEEQRYRDLNGQPDISQLSPGGAVYPPGLPVTDGIIIDTTRRYLNPVG